MDQALADDSATAYENFVDRLLASTDHAERQALRWLDGARYADTDGYQNDAERRNWPWRVPRRPVRRDAAPAEFREPLPKPSPHHSRTLSRSDLP